MTSDWKVLGDEIDAQDEEDLTESEKTSISSEDEGSPIMQRQKRMETMHHTDVENVRRSAPF
jgi:hypothetical protein